MKPESENLNPIGDIKIEEQIKELRDAIKIINIDRIIDEGVQRFVKDILNKSREEGWAEEIDESDVPEFFSSMDYEKFEEGAFWKRLTKVRPAFYITYPFTYKNETDMISLMALTNTFHLFKNHGHVEKLLTESLKRTLEHFEKCDEAFKEFLFGKSSMIRTRCEVIACLDDIDNDYIIETGYQLVKSP